MKKGGQKSLDINCRAACVFSPTGRYRCSRKTRLMPQDEFIRYHARYNGIVNDLPPHRGPVSVCLEFSFRTIKSTSSPVETTLRDKLPVFHVVIYYRLLATDFTDSERECGEWVATETWLAPFSLLLYYTKF